MRFALALALAAGLAPAARAAYIPTTNLIVGGNLNSGHDVEGTVIVAGALSGNWQNSIELPQTPPYSYDGLVVGGNASGSVKPSAGNTRIGGNFTGSLDNNSKGSVTVGGTNTGNINANGGTVTLNAGAAQATTITQAAVAELAPLSAYYASLAANNTLFLPTMNLPAQAVFNALVADANNVATFTVDGSVFSNPNYQQFSLVRGGNVNANTTIVVNVAGPAAVTLSQNVNGGDFTSAATRSHLVFNFLNATTINAQVNVNGAILAPTASLTNSTAIDGSVFIGGNFQQNGEVHLPLFQGFIPQGNPVPEPASVALVGVGAGVIGLRLRRRAVC